MKKTQVMTHCCNRMHQELTKRCGDYTKIGAKEISHKERTECPDVILHKLESGTIGIVVHDGGGSVIAINHCPWCGNTL